MKKIGTILFMICVAVSFKAHAQTNIALNKNVTASSGNQPAVNAVDGDMGTRWESAFEDPQWITVKLDTVYDLNGVLLNWEGAFGSEYEIQVSEDSTEWTTFYSETNGDGGEDLLNLAGKGRYVRMHGTARGTPYGYSLWEFEIYGNVATAESNAYLSDLQVNGATIEEFDPYNLSYAVILSPGTTEVPMVTATAEKAEASLEISDAISLPGTTNVTVTAEDDTTTHIYSIEFTVGGGTEPSISAPEPTSNASDVISVYSNSYTNINGVNFNPFWAQETVVTEEEIEGNQYFKLENFNYQGIDLGNQYDISSMEYVHIDVWTSNASAIELYLISPGPAESSYSLPITQATWVSYDIPLSEFSSIVDLENVIQFKFTDGVQGDSPTFYMDNIYFYRSETPAEAKSLLSDLAVGGTTVADFNPNRFEYLVELPMGTTEVPEVTATADHSGASVNVETAASLPGTTTVTVTSEDGTNTSVYEIVFEVLVTPQQAPPTPPERDESNVISILSDVYSDVEGTNFYPNWAQSTQLSEITVNGTKALKLEEFNYQGIELSSGVDVSGMDFVHVDMWTNDAPAVNLSLISPGPSEIPASLEIVHGSWQSYDIPLSEFAGTVDLSDVFQFKFDEGGLGGAPTIYLSNLYFYKGVAPASNDATLADLSVDDVTISGFSPSTFIYTVELAPGTQDVPTVTATPSDKNAEVTITEASELPGTTTVEVLAEDGQATRTYSIEFVLLTPASDATLSELTVAGEAIEGFSSNKFHYNFDVGSSSSEVPEVLAISSQEGATVEVTKATEIPGHTVIKVISEDGNKTTFYSVFFKTENLLWWDEFSGSNVNADYWSFETGNGCDQGNCGWGNQELQTYSEENIAIEHIPEEEGNTAMVITAESTEGGGFSSGRVITKNKVDIKFGKLEVRVKIPDLQTGLWPAVWLLGSNIDEVGWPRTGELDIMEMGQKAEFRASQGHSGITENQYVSSNIFWYSEGACVEGNPTCAASIAGDAGYNKPYASATEMNSRFQIYRLYWTNSEIRFTVEDQGEERDLYEAPFGITSQELQDIFAKDFFIILNMAVGGTLTDAATANQVTAPFPAKMYIDYVRLHKLNGQGEVNIDGIDTANESDEGPNLPKSTKLYQNYPNPFNPTTQISYEIEQTSNVKIRVIDMLGRTVSVIENGRKNAGIHHLNFDASRLSSGVYLYTLEVNQQMVETRKMLLIK